MDTDSSELSNTEVLFFTVQRAKGKTFTDKAKSYLATLDAQLGRVAQGSDEWRRLLCLKGQVEGFIRHDTHGQKDVIPRIAHAA